MEANKNIPPLCLINFDATQYYCELNGEGKEVMVRKCDNNDQPITRICETGSGVFIKHYFMCNALGNVAPPLFVVSDESLPEDEVVPIKISGLTHSQEASSFGYLCFTKTRAGNDELYKWYFKTVLLEFVAILRESYPKQVRVCSNIK
jgi:hypothetical protein